MVDDRDLIATPQQWVPHISLLRCGCLQGQLVHLPPKQQTRLDTLNAMPFDPPTFEAELTLKLIPTERLPALAQDALEAGFAGPHIVRMAIMEPTDGWAIDQTLPPMLEELGCHSITPKEAALRLAHQRAKRIPETGEDPIPSLPYFYRLMQSADYLEELMELAYLEDDYRFFTEENDDKRRALVHEAIENILSPELPSSGHPINLSFRPTSGSGETPAFCL